MSQAIKNGGTGNREKNLIKMILQTLARNAFLTVFQRQVKLSKIYYKV